MIHFVDKVITVSDSIAIEYVHLYGITKPNIVLNCPFYCEQEKKNLFREIFNLKNDQNIFLYQGGLKASAVEVLMDAFTDLDSDKNILICMGYGPYKS